MENRIKKLREANGMTQQELADRLHCDQQSISNYENNKYRPDWEIMMQLAAIFDTTVDYLIGYSDYRCKDSRPPIKHADFHELIDTLDDQVVNYLYEGARLFKKLK